jgi:hypothetical protein
MYVALQLLFALAALGVFLIYFFIASVFGLSTAVTSTPTIVAAAVSLLMLLLFSCGLNAGLLRSYAAALEGRKTTVAEFLRYSLQKAPEMFAITVVRDLLLVILVAPLLVAYVYSFKTLPYMDIFVAAYALGMTFLIHFLFTPALLSMGVFGTDPVSSFRNGIGFLKRKHFNAMALYAVFALVWLLNFVPVVQIITIFVVYPAAYSALIVMFQGSGGARTR